MRSRVKPKKKKKMSLTAKIVWITVLSFILAIAVYLGYVYMKANAALGEMGGAPTPQSGKSAVEKALEENRGITFLLTGLDSRSGSGGSMNTDVIMLAAWNPQDKAVTMMSIPRDTLMHPDNLSPHKANYYYAYYYNRDRDTALANTKKLYSEMLGIPIDYMAVIDFKGLVEVVDLFGGLEIDVDMDMKYVDNYDGTNINLKRGLQTLEGKETLDFIRYRKSNRGTGASSDIERNARQQQVIEKLVGKIASVNGALKLGEMLEIAGSSLKTDIPQNVLKDWLFSAMKLKPNTFDTVTLEGTWDSPYIYMPDEEWERGISVLKARIGMEGAAAVPVAGTKPNGNSTVTGSTYKNTKKPSVSDSVYKR